MRRVLFVAEAVTLAHMARPLALARSLDPARFEVVWACDPRFDGLLGALPLRSRPIRSISTRRFLDSILHGRPIFDAGTLAAYAREDLALLDEVRPDLVIGDLRLSLSASARVAGVPYAALASACWSPFARLPFAMPEHALTPIFGRTLMRAGFRLARPLVFAAHARPLNRLRRGLGLPALEGDLRSSYTDADYVLYPDVPELVPTFGAPASHRYLGPILWSPAVPPPPWWSAVPGDRPVVYLTLGSSGAHRLLPMAVEAIAALDVTLLVATAGADPGPSASLPNVRVAEYLPGIEAARMAEVVVGNGGSPTSHQALAAGVPVVGIASNLDQLLNMAAVERAGAGVSLHADDACTRSIRAAVERARSLRGGASRMERVFSSYRAEPRLAEFLEQELAS